MHCVIIACMTDAYLWKLEKYQYARYVGLMLTSGIEKSICNLLKPKIECYSSIYFPTSAIMTMIVGKCIRLKNLTV